MIKTHIKVALRNLLRDKAYTALNMLGLSAGMACALIIFLYVRHELSFDNYHPDPDRTYRLASHYITNGVPERSARSSPTIGPLLQQKTDGIETVFRMRYMPPTRLEGPHGAINQENIYLADSNVAEIFGIKALRGDVEATLRKPNHIVLTRSLAQRLFGHRDPIGDSILAINQYRYHVGAIIEDLPDNTHHRFTALLSYKTYEPIDLSPGEAFKLTLWIIRDYVFLKFKPGHGPNDLLRQFPAFYTQHMAHIGDETHGGFLPILQPLPDIHLNRLDLEFEYFPLGNPVYIYAFSAVGGFILLLACINFVNIATARSALRAREVGLKKVLGSRQSHLLGQFLGESVLLTFAALLLALGLAEVTLALTPFNALMGTDLQLDLLQEPQVLAWAALAALLLGILSGIYPALYLTSFEPADALRARSGAGHRGPRELRKAMVLVQFTIAIGVIICTFLMRHQVEYMRSVDLGYESMNIAVIPVNDSVTESRLPEIRAQLEAHPHIRSTTTARHMPGRTVGRMFMQVQRPDSMEDVVIDIMAVGDDYIKGMGLSLTRGRDFNPGATHDSLTEFIVNESAAQEFWGGDALDQQLKYGFKVGPFKERKGPVVGVVKDFTVHSLHFQRRPLVLVPTEWPGGLLHIRMDCDSMHSTMAFIHDVWQPHEANGSPFTPTFIDEAFDKLYATDQRNSRLMGILAWVCMLISAIGLIGFASYSIVQRRREIGIRKVMGASVLRILLWLFTDIFYLIAAASMAGSVLALVVFNIWLGEFAYHAEIPLDIFFYTGGSVMLLALLTVALHSLRTAIEPPIKALRTE